jgi:hypothetical protein
MLLEDRAATRSFSFPRLYTKAALGNQERSRVGRPEEPPGGSHVLLEGLAAALPGDHDEPVARGPRDCPADQRVAGERPIAVPDRSLERVRELVAGCPPLDIDELVPVEPGKPDRVRSATNAGAPGERDDGDRRVASRRASSSQTSERDSSVRAGRSLDVWVLDASLPDGVRQGCPGNALQVGQRRSRQPRAQ